MTETMSFLGRGWSFPVTFTQGGKDLLMVNNEAVIEQSLEILLTTEASERLMHPYFGCELSQFVYEGMSSGLIGRIKNVVTNSIVLHEPRIDLIDVKITQDKTNRDLLLINMNYLVRTTNTRSNKVYPFYLKEASFTNGSQQ